MEPSAIDVLVVCTGNICRSPMAQGLLDVAFVTRGQLARVHSAGLVTEDRPASAHGVDVMARRGVDISAHRSRLLSAELVAAADLVIGMERQHLREAVVLEPSALARSFTLPELARRMRGGAVRRVDETVADYLVRIAGDRTSRDLLGANRADEVADPYGMRAAQYERVARQIADYVDDVVAHLVPDHPAP